ncbi:MAG: hypothetical protein RR559_11770, partial [Bacteroides sp.]
MIPLISSSSLFLIIIFSFHLLQIPPKLLPILPPLTSEYPKANVLAKIPAGEPVFAGYAFVDVSLHGFTFIISMFSILYHLLFIPTSLM